MFLLVLAHPGGTGQRAVNCYSSSSSSSNSSSSSSSG